MLPKRIVSILLCKDDLPNTATSSINREAKHRTIKLPSKVILATVESENQGAAAPMIAKNIGAPTQNFANKLQG